MCVYSLPPSHHLSFQVWRKAITSEHIKLKYNRNGLFPLNPNAISNERISTANQLMAKAQMAADRQGMYAGMAAIDVQLVICK